MIPIHDIQADQAQRNYLFEGRTSDVCLLNCLSEFGHLSRMHYIRQLRPDMEELYGGHAKQALAGVVLSLMDFCTHQGWDFVDIMRREVIGFCEGPRDPFLYTDDEEESHVFLFRAMDKISGLLSTTLIKKDQKVSHSFVGHQKDFLANAVRFLMHYCTLQRWVFKTIIEENWYLITSFSGVAPSNESVDGDSTANESSERSVSDGGQ